jgi:hypothetical protein
MMLNRFRSRLNAAWRFYTVEMKPLPPRRPPGRVAKFFDTHDYKLAVAALVLFMFFCTGTIEFLLQMAFHR